MKPHIKRRAAHFCPSVKVHINIFVPPRCAIFLFARCANTSITLSRIYICRNARCKTLAAAWLICDDDLFPCDAPLQNNPFLCHFNMHRFGFRSQGECILRPRTMDFRVASTWTRSITPTKKLLFSARRQATALTEKHLAQKEQNRRRRRTQTRLYIL